MATPVTPADRIMGSLIGGAVGDALGAPTECMHYRTIRREYGDFKNFEDLVAVKAGWNPIGTVTDDTVLADLLMDCILEHDGDIDAHVFAAQWAKFEQPIPNPDGAPIIRLNQMHWIERIPFLRNMLREVQKRELGHGEANATNAVMYIAPVGLLCAGDPLKAALMAADVTAVNQHGAPRDVAAGYAAALAACFVPGATVEGIVATAMTYTRDWKQTRDMQAMLDLAAKCADCEEFTVRYYTEILGPVLPFQDVEHLDKNHWKYTKELTCNSWTSSEVLGPTLATFLLTKGQDAATMMLACSKIGRDSDTICRCAGGLIGAWAGRASIPAEWQSFVLARNRWLRLEEKGAALVELVRRRSKAQSSNLLAVCG